MSKTEFTANQTAILNAVRTGATTDAEIGESFDAKLSTIATVARSLIKRGVLTSTDGRYAIAESYGTTAPAEKPAKKTAEKAPAKPKYEPNDAYDAEFADLGPAVSVAVKRQLANETSLFTASGKTLQVQTVGADYVTLDGLQVVTKTPSGKATKAEPWTLWNVVTRHKGKVDLKFVGTYRSSTAALTPVADADVA